MTDEKTPGGPSGQDLVEQTKAARLLDALFEQIDAGQVEVTGDGGFVPALVKAALERGLQAELSSHLGYEKGSEDASKHANSRNGTSPKAVQPGVGPSALGVPRDRAGSFTQRLVPKGAMSSGTSAPAAAPGAQQRSGGSSSQVAPIAPQGQRPALGTGQAPAQSQAAPQPPAPRQAPPVQGPASQAPLTRPGTTGTIRPGVQPPAAPVTRSVPAPPAPRPPQAPSAPTAPKPPRRQTPPRTTRPDVGVGKGKNRPAT